MSDHEFENYLTLISRFLRLSPAQREAIGEELRDHSESRLAELVDRGHSHDEAVRLALEEFGDAAGLAADFSSITQTRRRRLIMRCTVAPVAALAAAVIVAMAVWPDNHAGRMLGNAVAETKQVKDAGKAKPENPTTAPVARSKSEIDASLDEYIELEFIEIPLKDVLDFLQDRLKIQMYYKAAKLKSAGIDPSTLPISINLKRVRARMALDLVLEQAAPDQLGYFVRDGILFITTKQELEGETELRVYDCRKLLFSTDKPVQLRDPNGKPVEAPTADLQPEVIKLMHVIESTVARNTWSDQGGQGSISEYNGVLVVNNTPTVQTQVAALLDSLAQELKARPAK